MTSPQAERAAAAVEEALHKPVEEMRLGEEATSAAKPATALNGSGHNADSINGGGAELDGVASGGVDEDEDGDGDGAEVSVASLKAELDRVKHERDSFEGQYHGLLSKLGQMRSTLGDRLRQDAEELDRREQQIDTLTSRVDELSVTVKTLEGELVTSHSEVERLTGELDAARQEQSNNSAMDRKGTEARLRELQEMAERYRIEAESWESACMEERAYRDDLDLQLREARRERDEAQSREQEQTRLAQREQDTARGLQQVLEEFQEAQESELQRAVGDHEEKLARFAMLISEHETRTTTAEAMAVEYKDAAERCRPLEKEVKEKNLLIGKLRHEAVILNEHLTESLRRLRANQSDSHVDGKLITNLLIQFLNTPRSDTKRFEMLNLIASVLSWTVEDRERAGLQRSATGGTQTPGGDRKAAAGAQRGTAKGSASDGGKRSQASEESFSNLFVEFLLSEAEKAKLPKNTNAAAGAGNGGGGGGNGATPVSTTPSSPTTPKFVGRPSFNLGSLASLNRTSTEDGATVRSPASNGGGDPTGSPRSVRSP